MHTPAPPEVLPSGGLLRDTSLPAVVAGLIAVLVSYSGPMVIVLTAAAAGHLSPAQTTSWIWAVSIGSGVTCVGLSLWTRQPVITAWSTPGAALLVTSLPGFTFAEAVGAYVACAVAMTLVGASGIFGQLMRRVPMAVVSAMLAGILFAFGVDAFTALAAGPLVPGVVLASYFVVKRFTARYAVLVSLVLGTTVAALHGEVHLPGLTWALARPEWTTPEFSIAALVGIGLPLFIVTMASQNATGLAVLRGAGYAADDRRLIGTTGLASLLLAPFGSHALNLAAITAAICTSPEAHPDPRRRYPAGVFCGLFYLVVGAFGSTLLALFTGLPPGLVAAVAGMALLGALTGGLRGAMEDEEHREAAVVTFLVTASGLTFGGIGAAFWGLVLGMAVYAVRARPASGRATSDQT